MYICMYVKRCEISFEYKFAFVQHGQNNTSDVAIEAAASSETSPCIPGTNTCLSFYPSSHRIIDLVPFLDLHFSTRKSRLSHCLFFAPNIAGSFFSQIPRNI